MLRLARALPRAGRLGAALPILFAVAFAGSDALAQTTSWEANTRIATRPLPGFPPKVMVSPRDCQMMCLATPNCRVWTYASRRSPPPGAEPGQCMFGAAVGARSPSEHYISGVVGAAQPPTEGPGARPGADPGTAGMSVQELGARCSRATREEPRSVIAACTAIIERESARVTNLDVVYHSRAIARHRLKQDQLALRDSEQSLRINSRNERSLELHGNILATLKRYPEALEAYRRALEAAPADPGRYSIHRNRAITYVELRNVGAALSDLDRCIEIGPGEARCWSLRGELKAERGRNAEALADFDEALRLDPSFGQAYYRRSLVHRKMGNATQANADLAQSRRFGFRPSANKP